MGRLTDGHTLTFISIRYVLYIQCLQKESTHPDFCHILLCYNLNLKWVKFNFVVADQHKIPPNDEMKTCF